MNATQKNQQTQHGPINRCFGGNCSQNPEQKRTKKIKDVLSEVKKAERAKDEINCLLERYHGRYNLVDLLPVVARRYSPITVKVLLERIKRKWDKLTIEQQCFVRQFEAELKKADVS